MTCGECGVSAPRRARFCPRCGAPLATSDRTGTGDGSERREPPAAARLTRVWGVVSVALALVAVLAVARLITGNADPGAATPPPSGSPPGLDVEAHAGDCVGSERGCVAWRLTAHGGGSFTGAALLGGVGYVGVDLRGDGGGVIAFSVATGEVRWTRRTNRPVQLAPAVADDTVVVVEEPPIGQDSVVHAFDAASGERRWRSRAPFRAMVAPTIADGRLLIAGYPPAGIAIELRDPTRTTPLPVDGIVRGPVLGHDGMAYLALAEALVAMDLRGDGRDWQVADVTAPADRVVHGHLVAVDGSGSVVAYGATTGEEVWRTDLDAALVPPLVDDARVIVAGDAEFTALDPATGQIRYRRRVPLPIPLDVGSHAGTVYHLSGTALTAVALGAGAGAPPDWSHTFADDGAGNPPAISVTGRWLILSTRSELVVFLP